MKGLRKLMPILPMAVAVTAVLGGSRHAVAEDATATLAEKKEKCATRLSIAMVGEGASSELLAASDPQAAFDGLVADPRFVERFARFVNAQFNISPGLVPAEDASYSLARYVLENGRPWADMFVGQYDVVPSNANQPGSAAMVTTNPNGLGYFRSRAWMVRYAGNELEGMRIVAAYRIMQNTIGLKLVATTSQPNVDLSVNGRKSAQCASCHFDKWYALDKVATVLGTKTGMGDATQFQASAAGPQNILGGVTVSNDAELVQALVTNEAFNVNACRLAFKYLYGRAEYSCEGPVFDKCVDAFTQSKLITSALAVVAKDPSFCE